MKKYTLLRIALEPNTTEVGIKRNFMVYGILIIPLLLGWLIFHQILELKGEYMFYAIVVLLIVLINVFFFYKNRWSHSSDLYLVIDEEYLQFLNAQQLFVQEPLSNINTEIQWCERSNRPAILIKGNDMPYILIGQNKMNENIKSNSKINTINQPDYWLTHSNDWNKLIQTFRN